MKIILCLAIMVWTLSCDRHSSQTFVYETSQVKVVDLNQKELIVKAFLNRDYEALEDFFSQGVPVDTLLGTDTLLTKAIEERDFQMVNFLIQHKANPDTEIKTEEGVYTPRQLVLSVEEELRDTLLAILDANIESVNEFIYYSSLNYINEQAVLNLSWLSTLLSPGIHHADLTEDQFIEIYIGEVGKALNRREFYYQLVSLAGEDIPQLWRTWVEAPFTTGRYARAKCTLTEREDCETFDSFLEGCPERFIKPLIKSKAHIIVYIEFRNALFLCP